MMRTFIYSIMFSVTQAHR